MFLDLVKKTNLLKIEFYILGNISALSLECAERILEKVSQSVNLLRCSFEENMLLCHILSSEKSNFLFFIGIFNLNVFSKTFWKLNFTEGRSK